MPHINKTAWIIASAIVIIAFLIFFFYSMAVYGMTVTEWPWWSTIFSFVGIFALFVIAAVLSVDYIRINRLRANL